MLVVARRSAWTGFTGRNHGLGHRPESRLALPAFGCVLPSPLPTRVTRFLVCAQAVAESSARRASDGTDYPPCNKQPVGVPRASRSPGGAESLFTVKPAAPPAGTVPLSPWAPVPANVQRARAGRKPPEATPSRHANNLVDWIGSQVRARWTIGQHP